MFQVLVNWKIWEGCIAEILRQDKHMTSPYPFATLRFKSRALWGWASILPQSFSPWWTPHSSLLSFLSPKPVLTLLSILFICPWTCSPCWNHYVTFLSVLIQRLGNYGHTICFISFYSKKNVWTTPIRCNPWSWLTQCSFDFLLSLQSFYVISQNIMFTS